MTCFRPLTAYRGLACGGKAPIVFARSKAIGPAIKLPCGQCIGCRMDRSRSWALRCVHEASLHKDNCFITLTYNDDYLPYPPSVSVRDCQLFLKRLRKFSGRLIKMVYCGEYGETSMRPHYHFILFGYDFSDKVHFKNNDNGDKLYVSADLLRLWPYGNHFIGDVTWQSSAYVARYIIKKRNGTYADEYYTVVDDSTGEVFRLVSEFFHQSRRPGIGKGWIDKYSSDVYPEDYVVHDNRKYRPPRYYDNAYEIAGGDLDELKLRRVANAERHSENNTDERLAVRETVARSRYSRLKRSV